MAEVTNELIYKSLKTLQGDLGRVTGKMDEVKHELQAVRIHLAAMQQDTSNISSALMRQDSRLDRIERRLELTESPLAP